MTESLGMVEEEVSKGGRGKGVSGYENPSTSFSSQQALQLPSFHPAIISHKRGGGWFAVSRIQKAE